MNPAAALATPVERRAWVPVASVSRTIDASQAIGMHLSGQALVSALQELRSEELLVVDLPLAVVPEPLLLRLKN